MILASQSVSGDTMTLRPSVALHDVHSRAASAAGCSGYYSDVTPPPTINVYYNGPHGDGKVHTYDFMSYVKNVLPNEMGCKLGPQITPGWGDVGSKLWVVLGKSLCAQHRQRAML